MHRLLILTVLAGLVLSFGCGSGKKTVEPTNVPPPPKSPPGANKGPGGAQGQKPATASDLTP